MNERNPRSPILFHLEVYALGDRIQHDKLKAAAAQKFDSAITADWRDPVFATAVRTAYEVAPPGPTGDTLRAIVLKVASQNAKMLLKRVEFEDMMDRVAQFGKELAQVMTGCYKTKLAGPLLVGEGGRQVTFCASCKLM